MRSRGAGTTVVRPLISFVRPRRVERPSPRLKGACSTRLSYGREITRRVRAFELLLHVGVLRIERRLVQSTRGLQPRPEPLRSARPKTKKPPRRISLQGGSRSFGCFSLGLPGALPFVGRGLRLALGTLDDSVPCEGRPIAAIHGRPRAHVSRCAFVAPGHRVGLGSRRHLGWALRRQG
jgi:hypothetical protein